MADVSNKPVVPSVEPPHDRVVGVSLRNDGTVAENNPEIIGDKDAALEATQEQFRQFAVSAVDVAKRDEIIGTEAAALAAGEPSPDKAIDALRKEHEKAEAAADKAAEALVNKLHKG